MIIDAHCHWLPDEVIANAHFYHKAWGDIEAQLAAMQGAGIDQAVLSYPTSDAFVKLGGHAQVAQVFNERVAAIVKRYPGKFVGAAIVPFGEPLAMRDALARAVEEQGFKAASLPTNYDGVYLDDARFAGVFAYCQKQHLPVFVHAQIVNPIGSERVRDPLLTPVIEYVFDTTICIGKMLMSGSFAAFPDLAFVFGSFGGVVPFLAYRFDMTYRMLRGINFVKDLGADPTQYLQKIYVDTSGDTQAANLQAALALLGPGHILWGSDWPAKKDPAAAIKVLETAGLKGQEKNDILGNNCARLLKGA